jgi:hypothetical protein
MLVATRTFTAIVDGREETITARRDFAEPSCDVVRDYPDCWAPATGRAIGSSRAVERSAQPGRQLTAEEEQQLIRQQGRIRRARLDELAARERERPQPPDAETLFWKGVDRLLGFDRLERQAEDDEQFLGRFDAAKASDIRTGVEGLSEWLDR